jgi:hypothetical protein
MLQLIQENPNGVNMNLSKSLLFQLCKAIEKCHSLDIIHRGKLIRIKFENYDRNYSFFLSKQKKMSSLKIC